MIADTYRREMDVLEALQVLPGSSSTSSNTQPRPPKNRTSNQLSGSRSLTVGRVGDIKAEEMVGDGAAKEGDGLVYLGKVEAYDKTSQWWKVKYEADADEFDFLGLSSAKQLYDANGSNSGDAGANSGGDGSNDAVETSQNNA